MVDGQGLGLGVDRATGDSFMAIAKIEVARLLPGDVLVASVRGEVHLTESETARLRDQLRQAFPAWVAVVAQGIDFRIARQGDGGETGKANQVEGTERESGEAQSQQE